MVYNNIKNDTENNIMNNKVKQRGDFLINILYFAAIVILVFLFFKYAFDLFSPFLVGLCIAIAIDPLIRFLNSKLKVNRVAWSVFLTLLTWSLLSFLVFKVGEIIYDQAKNLLNYIQDLNATSIMTDINKYVVNFVDGFAPNWVTPLKDLVSRLVSSVVTFATDLLGNLTNFLLSIPNLLIFLVVSIVSSVFISIDLPKIKSFLIKQIPARYKVDILESKEFLYNKIFRIVRAYVIIICITFAELLLGFMLIDIEYAVLMAFLVSVLDLLPIVGTSSFLIPWALVTMIGGDIKTGIGLIVIAVIVSVVREVIQPRIVGSQIGLTPLLTLISMYVGLKAFGLPGLFIAPISLIFIKNLNDSGRINLWKSEENPEITDIIEKK
jgi:sporulation integral membrane protein YtvI